MSMVKGLDMPPDRDISEEVFLGALSNSSAAVRMDYLNEACDGDILLRQRVDALLAAYHDESNFLKLPDAEAAFSAAAISEGPGRTIGRYKLLEEIGEGGFGVVFMAEQEQPVRRKVALKIIKAGMDTRQVVARFEAERQALAMMDHPNIAKVLDAGATDTGRPYFVMELIKGIPITKYCDEQSLSIRDRMQLFIQVCHAVQHAHQKGIIHRDLKPSNVLLTLHDDKAVPKIIDFGVAKATEGKLTDKTLFTGFRQLIGTPTYMSPEQAQFSGIDIDTRSDIYSLGVLLYELLTGTTPLDAKTLLSAAFGEIQRMIGEEEPPKPSTRLSTLAADTQTARASQRRSDPKRLTQQLRGDLDWIVMRCLEKDRSRRYETAAGLAEDVQRYLNDEPVLARRPTRWYRLKKFIRRNKVGVLAGSAILATLLFGLTLSSVGFLRASRQEQIASTQAARSEQVAQFLKDMLAGVGPSVAVGRDTKLLREILDKTAARVQQGFADDPAVRAELCYTLGTTYADLSDYAHAEPMFQNAVEQYRRAFGNENTNVALALARLGATQTWLNKASVGKLTADEGVRIARSCGDKGTLAHCLYYQAGSSASYIAIGEEVPILREAIALEKEVGDDPKLLGYCVRRLADALDEPGTHAEAESLMREALALHRQQSAPDDTAIASDLFMLAQCLMKQGKLDEAESTAREVVEFDRRVLDKDHIGRALAVGLLGHVLIERSKWEEAEALFKEALDASPSNYRYWQLLGQFNARRGNWPASVEQYSRAIELHPEVGDRSPLFLAVALVQAGHLDEYRQLCHRFLEQCSGTHEFADADKAAKAALLLPVDGADLDRACKLADFAATATEPKSLLGWVQFCKALAEYRRGHFTSAVDWANRAISSSMKDNAPAQAGDYFIQACAYAQLQQIESARAALGKGDELVKHAHTQVSPDFSGAWADWTIAELLHQEAKKLLVDTPATDMKSKKSD